MKDWKVFFQKNESLLKSHYPGLSLERFLKEAKELKQDHSEDFLKGIPFAYLLGFAEFWKDKFIVNSHVLIPRQETEFLVEKVLNKITPQMKNFVDVGCGSGCIGLSLLKEKPQLTGLFIDISEEALKVARINAEKLGVLDRAKFLCTDRLLNVSEKFDFIVSNPPYIKRNALGVHPNVEKYEPHLALFLEENQYQVWFHEFFKQVKAHLNPQGFFAMEGHEEELALQAKSLGSAIVEQDLTGRDRFLFLT